METLAENDGNLIEKKLLGQLTDDEAALFLLKMNDESFSKVFQKDKLIFQGILEQGDTSMKNVLKGFENDLTSNQDDLPNDSSINVDETNNINEVRNMKKKTFLRWFLLILIAGLAAYLIPKALHLNVSSQGAQTIDSLYETYPNVVFNVELNTSGTKGIGDAFASYAKGEYQQAYDLFEALPEELITPDMYFYMGQCLMGLEKYEDAVAPLRTGGKYGSQFEYPAKYYLVIAFFEMGNTGKWESIMQKLIDKTGHDESENGVYWNDRIKKLRLHFADRLNALN